MPTFSDVLAGLLRSEPGRPLITYYDVGDDEAAGERVELSVTTYANWVAKASSLLVDELGLERGDAVVVDLPPHWLGCVFLGAAWHAGLVVTDPEIAEEPAAVVTGPAGLARWAAYAGPGATTRTEVLACSLLPLGVRFAEPLPPGVRDVGVEIWSQPDSFMPWDPATPQDPAYQAPGVRLTQAEMWEAAAAGLSLTSGGRLLSEANPASPPGRASFTEPLAKRGSVVLVRHADAQRLEAIAASEHVTHRFPA